MKQIESSTVIETMLLRSTRKTTPINNFKMRKERNSTNDSQYI